MGGGRDKRGSEGSATLSNLLSLLCVPHPKPLLSSAVPPLAVFLWELTQCVPLDVALALVCTDAGSFPGLG